jgi:hypothetical protein
VIAFAWFTRSAPSPLAAAVAAHGGYLIYEAVAVSEILAVMEQHKLAILVIDFTVEDEAAAELQHRFITLRLKSHATVADILWELSGILPDTAPHRHQ